MAFSGMLCETAPAAADIQHSHALPRADLAANQLQLVHLRIVQVLCSLPVAAAVVHALVEHQAVQVIAQVVVPYSYVIGPAPALPVDEPGSEPEKEELERPSASDPPARTLPKNRSSCTRRSHGLSPFIMISADWRISFAMRCAGLMHCSSEMGCRPEQHHVLRESNHAGSLRGQRIMARYSLSPLNSSSPVRASLT